jgi:flagellar motor switch protein FliG
MTGKKFIKHYTRFIQLAIRLVGKAKRHGIVSLEEEVEDIDETEHIFKKGLYLIIDGTNPATVNEILTNMAEHEKDKTMRLYKTIQKRAVLGIQTGESVRVLYKVLSSLAGLPPNEEKKIDILIMESDSEPEKEEATPAEIEIIEDDPKLTESVKNQTFVFDDIARLTDQAIQRIFREIDSMDLAKALKAASEEARNKVYKNLSKRAASMLREDMEYMGPIRRSEAEEAQQKIISIIGQLADSNEIIIG